MLRFFSPRNRNRCLPKSVLCNWRGLWQENLRELCLFKLANDSGKPWLWWDYVTKFSDQCLMADKHFNQECAEKVFNQVNSASFTTLSAWRTCIGDVHADTPNAMMEAEMKGQRGSGDVGEVCAKGQSWFPCGGRMFCET